MRLLFSHARSRLVSRGRMKYPCLERLSFPLAHAQKPTRPLSIGEMVLRIDLRFSLFRIPDSSARPEPKHSRTIFLAADLASQLRRRV